MLEKLKPILIQNIEEELKEIEQIKNEANNYSSPAIILPKTKFNFWERHISKRKEFSEYSKIYEKTIEEGYKKREDQKERYREIIKMGKITILNEKLEKIKKATKLSEIEISLTEVFEIAKNNNITITNEDCSELVMSGSSECAKNINIMQRSIQYDLSTLEYDQTNDDQIYLIAIEQIKKKLEEDFSQGVIDEKIYNDNLESLQKDENEIKNPKEVEPGKYKVPHKYLYEKMRQWISKGMIIDQTWNSYDRDVSHDYHSTDGKYDKEYGEKIQELYEREDVLLGMHRYVNVNSLEGKGKKEVIFENGLRNSTQIGIGGDARRTLIRTVKVKNSGNEPLKMIEALNYNDEDSCTIIVLIPIKGVDSSLESGVPIWGNDDTKDGQKYYVLPQYIYGAIVNNNGENEIELNQKQQKKNYKYLYYDISIDPSQPGYEKNIHNEEISRD